MTISVLCVDMVVCGFLDMYLFCPSHQQLMIGTLPFKFLDLPLVSGNIALKMGVALFKLN